MGSVFTHVRTEKKRKQEEYKRKAGHGVKAYNDASRVKEEAYSPVY